MRGLRDKVAVVTGAASGIGRAIALRLGEEGCRVGIFDVNGDGARETAGMLAASGGRGMARQVDITDFDAVAAAVAALEAEAGPIHILVNNAGWDRVVPFLQSDRALWRKVIEINLYGPLNLHYAVLPGMVQRGGGKVVNIASDAGRVGSSGEAVYSACKGGIVAFTKTLARELATSNVQLNTVCPGPTDTPLLAAVASGSDAGPKIVEGLKRAIPMRRLGRPDDYPGMVAFLASADADYITGQTISVSGGLTMHG
jgi:2-hydroxycyclohexanecarboxyl-CoA dehydrogenase